VCPSRRGAACRVGPPRGGISALRPSANADTGSEVGEAAVGEPWCRQGVLGQTGLGRGGSALVITSSGRGVGHEVVDSDPKRCLSGHPGRAGAVSPGSYTTWGVEARQCPRCQVTSAGVAYATTAGSGWSSCHRDLGKLERGRV
jgi:hypothetical protein